jgi:diguanylate cyclase (GGDEF)-like protein
VVGVVTVEQPVGTAARYTAAAEELAASGRWEEAYAHLRAAVRLLNGTPSDDVERLRREHAEARELSHRDSLTASYNRRYLDERLVALLAERWTADLCVALVDADHFKQVNDTFGHRFGDRVLQRIVTELSRGLPGDGFCARYGGEEFALVLPGCGKAEAVLACEAARERVARHPWHELDPGDGQRRRGTQRGAAHRHRAADRRSGCSAVCRKELGPQRRRVPG